MSTSPTPVPEPAEEQPGAAPEPEAAPTPTAIPQQEDGTEQEAVAERGETSTDGDPTQAESTAVEGTAAGTDPAQPVTFTERHRPLLGVIAVLVSLAVAAFFAVLGPSVEPPPGIRGLMVRWGAPLCWFLLAVVFTTWAMRMKPQITQRLSFVVLGCYLLYMTARFI